MLKMEKIKRLLVIRKVKKDLQRIKITKEKVMVNQQI